MEPLYLPLVRFCLAHAFDDVAIQRAKQLPILLLRGENKDRDARQILSIDSAAPRHDFSSMAGVRFNVTLAQNLAQEVQEATSLIAVLPGPAGSQIRLLDGEVPAGTFLDEQTFAVWNAARTAVRCSICLVYPEARNNSGFSDAVHALRVCTSAAYAQVVGIIPDAQAYLEAMLLPARA